MAVTVDLPETAEQLAALIYRLQFGEEILLAQNGVTIARIVPVQNSTQPRIPGQDKGNVVIAPDFNASLPDDILNDFLNPSLPET